jgi:phosphoinositide-3-kinase regulatory subunit 4
MLIMVTNQHRFYGIDLRTMKEVWSFENPSELGEVTALVFHKRNKWLLAGTSRGGLVLWDTRFKLRIKTWLHPSKTRINKLCSLVKDSSRLVAIASDHEVSLWDISKTECLQVWSILKGLSKDIHSEDLMNQLYGSGFKVCYVFFDKRCLLRTNFRRIS